MFDFRFHHEKPDARWIDGPAGGERDDAVAESDGPAGGERDDAVAESDGPAG